MAELQEKKRRRGSPVPYLLTPLLLLLLTAGVLILCYSLAPTHQFQKYLNLAFMDQLKTTAQTAGLHIIENEIKTEAPAEQTFETGEIQYPTFGEQFAKLEIDSIGLNVGVYFGANAELLERGACLSTQSVLPGEVGNAIIDAHVNTFFSELSDVKAGDTVLIYTNYGSFVYKVTELIEFNKSDKQYLAVTDEEYLTLYTCKPQVLGSSDLRIGVRCVPADKRFYQQGGQE